MFLESELLLAYLQLLCAKKLAQSGPLPPLLGPLLMLSAPSPITSCVLWGANVGTLLSLGWI